MNISEKSILAIQDLVTSSSRVLVITHVNPDGDAIGSLTAMGLALRQLNKKATLVCDDGSPARFNYLPLYDSIQRHPDADISYDLIISLDCGDRERMGQAYLNLPEPHPPLLNIDHHVTNTRFGDVNLVVSNCTSTTEILFYLFPALDVSISTAIATSLLTGLVTDTLGFRTSGVSSKTFEVAGALLETGADLGTITTQALLILPLSTLRLWQVGLAAMKVDDLGIIWTSISQEAREAIGHTGGSSGGLVNIMANVDEATMSAVLLEDNDHVYVGFRCRPPFSVAELALNLGGGGHPLAAGCTLEGPLEKAESLVISMAKETISQQRKMLDRR